MIEQLDVAPKARFTLRDRCIHLDDAPTEVASDFLQREAFGLNDPWGSASLGDAAQSHDGKGQESLRHRRSRVELRAACSDSVATLDRAHIGQIQVFQYLRRAPLTREVPAPLLGRQALNRRFQ